ncbi:MAG TPA: hypothetical protein VG826_12390 [Pirellulales bacterium]|nr:hypothetical protein [Pirellulales bacterium]
MLDFRPKGTRTTNYFSRGEQWKLLSLVFAAGLLVFLVEAAVNPGRWVWLLRAGGHVPGQPDAAKGDGRADGRHAAVEQPAVLRHKTAPGEFIAEAEAEDGIPPNKRFFDGVRPELLARVRDDTVFRSAESDAFYHLLKILDETGEERLEQASIGRVSFTQLFTQPKEFRGDLVTVDGTVRRVMEKTAPQNAFGIKGYWQVVLEPEDRDYPVVIYCLNLPPEFPRGEKLHEPVAVTGFYYRRLAGLSSGREIMTWPLLLSKTLRWQPRLAAAEPGGQDQAALNDLAVGLALAVMASLVVVWFVFSRTRRKTTFVMPHPRPGELSSLRHEELAPDVREQLANLARQDQASGG